MALAALVRKGAADSVIQVAATTLVRLGLVLSVLALAPFFTLEELGGFDLFVVGSTLVQLAVTIGMDSGLAIVSQRQNAKMRAWYLVVALSILATSTLVLGVVCSLSLALIPGISVRADLVLMAVGYGALLGAMILIFSWFRWQSEARTASLVLISSNLVSFAIAIVLVLVVGTIASFAFGLVLGGAIGVLLCLLYLRRRDEFQIASLRELRRRRVLVPIARELLPISVPYFFASAALLLRRVVDRAYILTLGDPELIGAYAIVARAAEIIGFGLSVPSVGFAPIFVGRHREEPVRRLARIMYSAYVAVSMLIVLAGLFVTSQYLSDPDDAAIALVVPLATSIIAGTLFLGETTIAAFGYVLARRPAVFTVFSAAFIAGYSAGIAVLSWLDVGISSLGLSFAVASFLFSTAAVTWSEKLSSFGYRLRAILLIKVVTLVAAVSPLLA